MRRARMSDDFFCDEAISGSAQVDVVPDRQEFD
jgi:hypothetical protein